MKSKFKVLFVLVIMTIGFIASCSIVETNSMERTNKLMVLDMKYYPPKGAIKDVAIMFMGGLGGGVAKYYDYEAFTNAGYLCLAVGYFKTENTPDELVMIPLEYFEKVLKTFKEYPQVKGKKLLFTVHLKAERACIAIGFNISKTNRWCDSLCSKCCCFSGCISV